MNYKSIGQLCLLALVSLHGVILAKDKHHTHDKNSADYIVVGAGAAGSWVIKELTDDFSASVIALEYGSNLNQDPNIATGFLPNIAWPQIQQKYSKKVPVDKISSGPYTATPAQKASAWIPVPDTSFVYHFGAMWGGSANHNDMGWSIGSPDYYDNLQQFGGPRWNNETFRQKFVSISNLVGATAPCCPAYLGTGGPITVTAGSINTTALNATFVTAMQTVGDPGGGSLPYLPLGYFQGVNTFLSQNGTSSYKTINGVEYRSAPGIELLNSSVVDQETGIGVNGRQLKIVSKALVDKVIFKGKKAIGVSYIENGVTKTAYARKKVIICAGGIMSPAILLRSGIGDSNLLQSLGIPVIYDNPNVGHNFNDQCNLYFLLATNASGSIGAQGRLYMLPDQATPRVTFNGNPLGQLTTETWQSVYRVAPPGLPNLAGVQCVTQCKSTSYVDIFTTNPAENPRITSWFYTDPEGNDLILARECYKFFYNVVKEMRILDSTHQYQVLYPPESVFTNPGFKDSDLDGYIERELRGEIHQTGTCKIGDRFTQGGVVDGNLHVHGVSHLMVADNSILPSTPESGGQSNAQAIGKIAVDIIREGY